MLAVLGAAITLVDGVTALPFAARAAAWALYWVLAGWVATGVWIIGHECGHQAFSEYKALNDSVGWVLHSALLLPYHPWRISHAAHHAATNSMEDDAVFVPTLRSEEPRGGSYTVWAGEAPWGRSRCVRACLHPHSAPPRLWQR